MGSGDGNAKTEGLAPRRAALTILDRVLRSGQTVDSAAQGASKLPPAELAFTLAIVRLGSKRFLSKATAFDVIVGIMLGSVMSRAITASASFFPTLLVGGMLFARWRFRLQEGTEAQVTPVAPWIEFTIADEMDPDEGPVAVDLDGLAPLDLAECAVEERCKTELLVRQYVRRFLSIPFKSERCRAFPANTR